MGLFDFLKRNDSSEGSGSGRKRAEINETAARLKDIPGAALLDVREPVEYMAGHIPGSMNIPVSCIDAVGSAFPDKATPIYVYCQSGARSRYAAGILRAAGFTDVTDLGGIRSYRGELET